MSLYSSLIRPVLFSLPTEAAHEIGLNAMRLGMGPEFVRSAVAARTRCDGFGEIERFGLKFSNPFGIAAGFDKNAVVARQLEALGFGFVEVGTVTFNPQPGNPKPRLFRLPMDRAIINRAGFNNEGTMAAVERLRKARPTCPLGINIGKNKDVPNEDALQNYLQSFDPAHEVADYIVVNVSSPNTPNLRELQKAESLEELLGTLQKRNLEKQRYVPLLVKIAPDLSEAEIETITGIATDLRLDGIIATNTTVGRDGLSTPRETVVTIGAGGLSGAPLRKRATDVVQTIFKYSKGDLPIIGVGGIFTPEDAFEKVAAGASLLQAYTGFVYQGATFARDINRGLARILKDRGFASIDEAVGSGVK